MTRLRVLGVAVAILAPAAAAAAVLHLALRRAEPAVNSTVNSPPTALRLWFTQRPELAVTSVRLLAAGGRAVPTGALTRADSASAPIVVPVRGTLAPGAYRVEWRTMARDGHTQRGAYTFTLRPSAAAAPAVAQPAPADVVVSPAWLRAHLADPELVVLAVDMAPGMGGAVPRYAAGHLPGARRLDVHALAAGDGQNGTLTMEMVGPDSARRVLAALGVSDQSRVVLYGPKAWTTLVARAFVTLDHAGLGDRTHVLDGGLEAWTAAGGATSTAEPRVAPGRLAAAPAGTGVTVDGAWLRARLADPSLTVLDARDRTFWDGRQLGHQAARTGRVPGAHNLFFRALLDTASGAFLPADSARTLFAAAGAPVDRVAPNTGRTMVVYCHIGQTASVAYLQARRSGARVRLYDGSFQDWSRRAEYPVEPARAAAPDAPRR